MAYLDIEQKEDTAEKLAKIAGKPTKNFLKANEVNAIVTRINSLFSLVKSSAISLDLLLSQEPKIELGEIVGNFIDVINSEPRGTVESPTYVTYTIDAVNFVQLFLGEPGNYNGITVTFDEADFFMIYSSNMPSPGIVDSRPYKSYTAILNQASTFAPTAVVLENSLAGPITWNYESEGYYLGTLSGAFVENKTVTFNNHSNGGSDVVFTRINNDQVALVCQNFLGDLVNGIVNSMSVEIRVYN